MQFLILQSLKAKIRTLVTLTKMVCYFLQHNFTQKNPVKSLWEPQHEYIIKSDMTQDPNLAYYPQVSHDGVPVLVESATKLDVDFKHYHKFKLEKANFKQSWQSGKLGKLWNRMPFDNYDEVNSIQFCIIFQILRAIFTKSKVQIFS